MKYIYTFPEYNILNKIDLAKSLNEIKEIEKTIDFDSLDESFVKRIKDFIKAKVQKVKTFFQDSENLVDYIFTGEDPDDPKPEIEPVIKEEEILLVYNEPKSDIINKYMIYNGTDATNYKYDFQSIFYSFNLGSNIIPNLKNTDIIKVAKYDASITRKDDIEYTIIIYALLDELEVDRELYGYGSIEEITPHLILYLKNVKDGYEKRLFDYLEDLLKQPPDYDEKVITTFNKKYINVALKAIELDTKLNN
jgi:hypothetical protein